MSLSVAFFGAGREIALEKDIFQGKALFQSIRDNGAKNPRYARPLRNGQSPSVVGDKMIAPAVVVLFYTCRPSTIFGTVVARIVDSFQGVLKRRALAEIAIETLERLAPTLADGNAPRSIVAVIPILGVIATPLHIVPDAVFISVRHAVYEVTSASFFAIKASAAKACVAGQTKSGNGSNCSTVTTAKPVNARRFCLDVFGPGGFVEDHPAAKTFARQIGKVVRASMRGIMELHHNLLCCGVMPWDCSLSRQGASVPFASPLYHVAEQMYTAPWPMEARAQAEMGVDVDAIIEEYAGK